jgi:hypothetical protein
MYTDDMRAGLRLTNAHGHFVVTSPAFAKTSQALGRHSVTELRRILSDHTGIPVTRYADVTTVVELLIMVTDANGDGLT